MKEIVLAAMLVTKRSAGIALEVNLREYVAYMTLPSVNKDAQSGVETLRRQKQKSKIGVSVTPKKDLCLRKILKK